MSPFVSAKQQHYMFWKHPKIAKKWAKKYGTLEKSKRSAKINKRIKKATKNLHGKNKKRGKA